jgi:hypothetical protein
MSFVSATKNNFSVKAYIGDKKTLLAFNFAGQDSAKSLAGFSIFCQPPGNVPGYYLTNTLRFENPSNHKQVAGEPPNSSVNAPIQKYRWTHDLGNVHQGLAPLLGDCTSRRREPRSRQRRTSSLISLTSRRRTVLSFFAALLPAIRTTRSS